MSGRPGDPRAELASAARRFYERGWMAGTAGNLSARLPDGSFWITASGRAKGELAEGDFVRVSPGGEVLEADPERRPRPSAETVIHRAIYELYPSATACYHVHSIESNLLARTGGEEELPLPPLEMLKGLGVMEEAPRVALAVLANHAQVDRIAADLAQRARRAPLALPAMLIRDHGLTTWAGSPAQAFHHVELLDYIFRYMVADRMLSGPRAC